MATIFSASSVVHTNDVPASISSYISPFNIYHGNDPTLRSLPGDCMDPNGNIELPDFRWPWDEYLNGSAQFTGGPHDYLKGQRFTDTYQYGRGSGIDSAAQKKSFVVLSMAAGTVIAANCNQPYLDCIVAVRHNVGSSVIIYSHLDRGSKFFEEIKRRFDTRDPQKDLVIPQSNPIEDVGCSGTGADEYGKCVVHLHLELRWLNVGGPYLGWEALGYSSGHQIDGYWITDMGRIISMAPVIKCMIMTALLYSPNYCVLVTFTTSVFKS